MVRQEDGERETATLDAVLAIAGELKASPGEVAIAWLAAQVAPLAHRAGAHPGLGTREQLDATLGATALPLTDEQARRLDEASAIALVCPTRPSPRPRRRWPAASTSCCARPSVPVK